MDKNKISDIVEKQLNIKVSKVVPIGKGATATAFRVDIENAPYRVVVKVGDNLQLLQEEKDMLDFLSPKVSFKIPKTYFLFSENGKSFLGMEYIEGKSGKNIFFVFNKKKLSNSIIDAFMSMQAVTNDKFGKYNDAKYDSWKEYYRDFFDEIYTFSTEKRENGELDDSIISTLQLVDKYFDIILPKNTEKAVLCHGDFWLPNLLIDFKKSELVGALDPFDVIWAEKEYELFCFTASESGQKLKLYDLYKSKNQVSKFCDLKVELYALCNELHWYKRLGSISHEYLSMRSKKLIKEMEKIGLA